MALRTFIACVGVAWCAATASAQKGLELVRLSSGEVHEARRLRTEDGGTTLVTALGELSVGKNDVADAAPAVGAQAEFAATVEGLHPANAAGQFAAAKAAAARGLWTAARKHLGLALDADADHAEALAMAAGWAKKFRQHAFETDKGSEQKAVNAWCDKAGADAYAAVVAVEKSKEKSALTRLRPALKALKEPEPWARWAGARLLADLRGEPERIKPLYRASLVDRSPFVRRACVRALKGTNDPVFVALFARNLGNPQQIVRMTAGEALGELGMKEAVEPLLAAAAGDGYKPPHSFISVTTQRAYVKDFDVEVAQGAVIADPIVDVVQDGTVLDVAVVQINIERTVYYTALRRLTGLRHGDDLSAWRQALAKK